MNKFLPVFLFVWLLGCENGSNGRGVDYTNEQGVREVYFLDKVTQKKTGLYRKYNPDGILEEEAYYVDDTLHGSRVLYQVSGDTLIIESYRSGDFHGTFKAFYDNGALQLQGEYVDNVMWGVWEKYYKSGQLMEEVTFSGNEENGPFTEYHENGNLKAKGNYLNGDREHGVLYLYDEAGVLTRKMDCNEGICKTIWQLE
ncbi:MAG: toxin-antitoxin system YwqK family antitoxin [Saprospiraceae bacterium]|nr:toxin-antitoxin system YwqK family antitoxin [Saprospiraceae bacterium]MDP4821330.1 toxin-antitoxin system YwqK family antitoxin [Saprospiraceae bacterium]MDP4999924.1 toxin-antitoxin system YwqK family antitoxin [Saprospiraceae bacterium]